MLSEGQLLDLVSQLDVFDLVVKLLSVDKHLCLEILSRLFDYFFKCSKCTLPLFVTSIGTLILLRHNQEEELIRILFLVFLGHDCRQLSHQLKLGPDRVHIFLLSDSLKCVTHNSDQHVEHGQLRDEGSQHEVNVAKFFLSTLSESF